MDLVALRLTPASVSFRPCVTVITALLLQLGPARGVSPLCLIRPPGGPLSLAAGGMSVRVGLSRVLVSGEVCGKRFDSADARVTCTRTSNVIIWY